MSARNGSEKVHIVDPSQAFRPEVEFAKKPIKSFRDYSIDPNDPIKERVRKTYKLMHTHQTVDTVREKMAKWMKFNHFKATAMDALMMLDQMVDETDPDIDLPNSVHAFQTAEMIRAEHPDKEWLQLAGLLHDIGKVMALHGEPHWAVAGDTFPVGCLPSNEIVYGRENFKDNPDMKNPKYNTKLGMYKENCGLENVLMSWGHDEYTYQALKHNKVKLPEEALYVIRFHSCYPIHTSGEYTYLMNDKDLKMLEWVKIFNKYDLYTKSDVLPDIEKLKPYYQGLIDKYCPGVLEW